jgi:transposase InsO family protein
MDVLVGTDFFTVEVLTLQGLVTYYVLFFIQLESRRVCLAGITPHPEQQWMEQMGRNVTMQKWGFLANSRYLLHDRDSKFCPSFRQLIEAGRVKSMALPARSPNLNAYAERWVRSAKQECLSKLILFGERPLRRALQQYVAHYHEEECHPSSPYRSAPDLLRALRAQSPGQAEPAPVPLAESRGKRG